AIGLPGPYRIVAEALGLKHVIHAGAAGLAGIAQQNSEPHAPTPSASLSPGYFCFCARLSAAAKALSAGAPDARPKVALPAGVWAGRPAPVSIAPLFMVRPIRLRATSRLLSRTLTTSPALITSRGSFTKRSDSSEICTSPSW